jgi:4-hydroxybenzoate polyprenyltransferase
LPQLILRRNAFAQRNLTLPFVALFVAMTFANALARLDAYERLIRLDKPVGILLLAWPTLWALWLASRGTPGWVMVWVFGLGTILMRSAGCAINDYADRRFDGQVERTRERPLARGEIAAWEALMVAALLALAAFALVLLFLNRLTMILSFAAFAVTLLYPFTKRFFVMPQAVLGIAFSFGIPMAYAAMRDNVPPIAGILMLATWFWVVAYDTQYAMVDREDDRKLGLKTSAIWFGRFDVVVIAACYVASLAVLVWVGNVVRAGAVFYLSLVAALGYAGFLVVLTYKRDRTDCFRAFRMNHWFGAIVFAGIVADMSKTGRWW